ncbi:coiled-coil domain-containing protein 81-like [Odontesthes bonariensis]|uniref:coiled-coil domain-containing protein 81-like n=1 Tax=Odontesthes bonariensis TaxID=219752 RepID=UPI003F586CEF
MTEILQLVSEEDRRTLPALSHLSKSDIDCVWAEISSYIKHQMTLRKGVRLPGLGTFTFSQQNLNTGNKFKKIQRPIFILAGKRVQSLGLKQTMPLAAVTQLPVVQLNFAAVSQETPFNRNIVEGCVKETLQLLFRALASQKNAFLTFKGIGVLSLKNNKVQMNFNRDFINAMEGTGGQLTGFTTKVGSSISLLSGQMSKLQRPETADAATLPVLCSPQSDNKAGDKDGGGLSPTPDQRNAGEVPQQRESKSSQTLQSAKMKAALTEELNPKPPVEASNKLTTSNSPQVEPNPVAEHLINVTCSGNTHAGQELCYLCMQREKREVPVYLRAEQQVEENVQEELLLLKEQLKDKQDMEQELAKLTEQREHTKQVAAFNLQMSKRKTISCSALPNTFIFPARPLTPPRRLQQQRYMNDLQSQIETRRKHEAQNQQNCLLMERLDQVQLIQELALQRAQQLQKKQEKTKHYKSALDTQVEDKKRPETPEFQPDNPRFNRCETAVSNAESRERAQKLFQVNFSAATQRQKEELQNRHLQLKKEKEMLRHNKMELILDRISRFEKKRDISKSLEDEWGRSVRIKHKREDEEKHFQRSAGQLLVDKLPEYRRCRKCKRRTTNCGETNIWKDSHYLAGSQFMI